MRSSAGGGGVGINWRYADFTTTRYAPFGARWEASVAENSRVAFADGIAASAYLSSLDGQPFVQLRTSTAGGWGEVPIGPSLTLYDVAVDNRDVAIAHGTVVDVCPRTGQRRLCETPTRFTVARQTPETVTLVPTPRGLFVGVAEPGEAAFHPFTLHHTSAGETRLPTEGLPVAADDRHLLVVRGRPGFSPGIYWAIPFPE